MKKTKLWQTDKDSSLHPLVEDYTVGNDQQLDQKLLGYDIQASIAHAQMLYSIGILKKNEAVKISNCLSELKILWEQDKFTIKSEHEDGHTAIEDYLVEKLGNTGKKIHTGRSRNDQVLVMLRLYMIEQLNEIDRLCELVCKALENKIQKHGNQPMPGYTHMQKAMPTTLAVWLGSYLDGFRDMQKLIAASQEILDQNPLGSAAGFGVSIELDKQMTADLLGFMKVQENPMYCGLSRGLFELVVVQGMHPIMVLAGKFAQDMLLFTTQEFAYFSLPDAFVTGSSIMPQKKNYDLFEVMRGNAHKFSGYIVQLSAISGGIGSGFQRDLQLTKPILIEATEVTITTLNVLTKSINSLMVHEDNLSGAITEEMKSVEKINQLVMQGVPFRDAYQKVKKNL